MLMNNCIISSPPSENTLVFFVTHCASVLHLRYDTIKTYVCGVRHHYILQGFSKPLDPKGTGLERLKLTLRGIKRSQCNQQRKRLPLTSAIMRELLSATDTFGLDNFDKRLLQAALIISWFGGLRCGELTVSSSFDTSCNLCYCDAKIVHFNSLGKCLLLTLRASKTDIFREGVTLHLFSTPFDLCPVKIFEKYLFVRNTRDHSPYSPLFITSNGAPLSRSVYIKWLHGLLSSTGKSNVLFNGHSARKGMATTLAASGVSDHVIRLLGRWASDVYRRYITTPPHVIANAQRKMANPEVDSHFGSS